MPTANDYFATNHDLTVAHTAFKSLFLIVNEVNSNKITFSYNFMQQRSSMSYDFYIKQYCADGSMGIKYNLKSYEVEFITYSGGDGYTAPLLVKIDGTTQNNFYLHRDHLGSNLAITNPEDV